MGRDRVASGGLIERRFWAPDLQGCAAGQELQVGAEAARHARVLRLASGDRVELFDGAGRCAEVCVVELEPRSLKVRIDRPVTQAVRGPRVVLVQCLSRASKLDDIVRMTTELGVSEIRLAIAERSISRGDKKGDAKLERLERVAREALRQSEGLWLPGLAAPAPLDEVIEAAPSTAHRIGLFARSAGGLPGVAGAKEVWLAIGPEGGFTAPEQQRMLDAGFVAGSLGPQVLRMETAAVAATALVLQGLRATSA